MNEITVLTPTYNRCKLLSRVYDNLKEQTYKDFVWLIVDDGSSDDTTTFVERWKKEGLIEIEYVKKQNEGKHKALRLGFSLVKTKYVVDFDDDDEYTSDCLETFINEWQKIENEQIAEIGSIRGLTVYEDGKVCGNAMTNIIGQDSIDSDYITMNYYKNFKFENITCYKTQAVNDSNIFRFPDVWMGRQLRFVSEGIFWSRLARKYKTRYIFKPLRIYNNQSFGITRIGNGNYTNKFHSTCYSIITYLNEIEDYYKSHPYTLIENLLILSAYSISLKLSYMVVIKHLQYKYMRIIVLMLYPIGFMSYLYLFLFKNKRCY